MLERDGFSITKQVFSHSEIDRFRELLTSEVDADQRAGRVASSSIPYAHELKVPIGDLASRPALAPVKHIIFDERILDLVRSVIGPDICYFGDSSISCGAGERGFHKDNVDRSDPDGEDWQSPYDVVRVAIYMQDTAQHSGGVKIRRGSHEVCSLWKGRAVNVLAEKGDVVMWKLTTTHSGNALLPRFAPWLALHPRIETMLPRWLFLPYEETRLAIFTTFGAVGSRHTRNIIAKMATRPDYQEHCRYSLPPTDPPVPFVQPTEDYGAFRTVPATSAAPPSRHAATSQS